MRAPLPRTLSAFFLLAMSAGAGDCVAQESPASAEASSGAQTAPGPVEEGSQPPPAGSASGAPKAIPKAFPAERYSGLVLKSPFAIASAPPEPAAPVENFATNFVVTGISKQKNKDGQETYNVFVRSRDMATRLVLIGDRPSDEGISVVSVEEAAVAAKSVVVLRKGSETGRVEFDQAAVSASASPAAPPQPGARPPTSAVRTPAKTATIPRPGMATGTIPRPGASQAVAPPPAAPPNGVPTSQEPRRRVRPIAEPP
jgi:hypothetical protein